MFAPDEMLLENAQKVNEFRKIGKLTLFLVHPRENSGATLLNSFHQPA
jgi:hypothetical protein